MIIAMLKHVRDIYTWTLGLYWIIIYFAAKQSEILFTLVSVIGLLMVGGLVTFRSYKEAHKSRIDEFYEFYPINDLKNRIRNFKFKQSNDVVKLRFIFVGLGIDFEFKASKDALVKDLDKYLKSHFELENHTSVNVLGWHPILEMIIDYKVCDGVYPIARYASDGSEVRYYLRGQFLAG